MAVVAVNPVGFNPNLAGMQRTPLAQNKAGGDQPNPVDGFQASLQAAQTEAAPAAKELTLQVTPSQMATQAFQTNLTALAMSGVSVSVVLLSEGAVITPQANPPAAPVGAASQSTSQSTRPAGNVQAEIDSAKSVVFGAESDVRRLEGKRWDRYITDYGHVDHSMSSGDLAEANSYLDSAKKDLSTADSKLKALDPDGARSAVQSACNFAHRARSAAYNAESREERYFQDRVRSAEEQAWRRRDEDDRSRYYGSGGGGFSSSGW